MRFLLFYSPKPRSQSRILIHVYRNWAIEHQPNVVYKIPCADCDWCYVGETGRCFKTRKKEHVRNVKTCANGKKLRNMRGHSTIA